MIYKLTTPTNMATRGVFWNGANEFVHGFMANLGNASSGVEVAELWLSVWL